MGVAGQQLLLSASIRKPRGDMAWRHGWGWEGGGRRGQGGESAPTQHPHPYRTNPSLRRSASVRHSLGHLLRQTAPVFLPPSTPHSLSSQPVLRPSLRPQCTTCAASGLFSAFTLALGGGDFKSEQYNEIARLQTMAEPPRQCVT